MTVNGRTGLVAQTVLTASSDAQNSLEGIATGSLQKGSACYTEDTDGIYVLFPADTQAPNGTTIIAATGGGNWIFQGTVSPTPGGSYALDRMLWVDVNSTIAAETGTPQAPFKDVQSAIDAADETISWQINILPGEYAHTGLTVPANRRIRFLGVGPNTNANQELANVDDLTTIITNNAPFTIELSSPDANTPSEIQFENLVMRFAPLSFSDTGNTNGAQHMCVFRNCYLSCPIFANSLGVASTVLSLMFGGEYVPIGDETPKSSYVNTVLGPSAATPEVNVLARNYFFNSGVTGINKCSFYQCSVNGVTVYGGVGVPSRFVATVLRSSSITSSNGANFEVDAFSNYWVEQVGASPTGGSFALFSEPSFGRQTLWYIDTGSGSDSNSGLSGYPLRTFAELQRRWGVRPHFTAAVTVNVTGNVDEHVVLRADVSGNGTVNVVGATTPLVNGATIATAQAWSYATGANGQDAQVTSATVADWSLYEANTGTNPSARIDRADGAFGFVLDTVGGVGTARVTRMGDLSFAPGPTLTMSDLAVAEQIDIVALPRMRSLEVDIQRLDERPGPQNPAATIQNIYFFDSSSGLAKVTVRGAHETQGSAGPTFIGCIIRAKVQGDGSQAVFLNCMLRGVDSMVGDLVGCGANEGFLVSNGQARHSDIFANSGSFYGLADNAWVYAAAGEIASFDSAGLGLTVDVSSTIEADELFGSGAVGYGFECNGRAYYQSGRPPKLIGAAGENIIGGTPTLSAALPFINANNNAMIVIDP